VIFFDEIVDPKGLLVCFCLYADLAVHRYLSISVNKTIKVESVRLTPRRKFRGRLKER
jgi:hypothetical protein